MQRMKSKLKTVLTRLKTMREDQNGEMSTSFIGTIIVGVVIIGLLIVAVNGFFPGFFTSMLGQIADKLNANW